MNSKVMLTARGVLVAAALGLAGCGDSSPPPPSHGEVVFKGTCKVCHAQGLNGAPIVGNAKMWGPRLSQGEAVLVQHASEGYGLMPAKGGNDSLTTEDIRAAVNFMLKQLEK